MNAALAMFDICDPEATSALIHALDDDEELVRHHAARALLATHGLSPDSKDPQHMIFRVMAKDGARREAAKKDILAAIEGRPLCQP
jgi:HEAT repeat protein